MPEPGARLGSRYTLLDRLGGGVAGEVWRGRDETVGIACAVKLLRAELVQDEGALSRLRAAIAWISQLTHPGIVPVNDVVVQDGTVALVSRLVPGESLRALLDRQGTVPVGAALLLTAQLCDALAAARHVGVAHGDVKPANLLLEPHPETEIAVRLTDFGMSALLGRAVVQQAAASNPAGAYAAPEIGRGEAPTEAADMYAVGVVLYEALTGRPPFGAAATAESARREPAAVLSLLPADLPDSAADALIACLDENPRRRPAAAAFAAVLRESEATQAASHWPVVAVAPGPDLSFLGGGNPAAPGSDLLPVVIERHESAVARKEAGLVVARDRRSGPVRGRGTRPWPVVGAALCGVALAAFITYGLTTHGSPHASASTLPARVAVIGPTGVPVSQSFASPSPTSTPSPTPSATASSSATATASASHAAPSASASAVVSPSPSPSNSALPVSHTGRLYNAGSGTCLDTSGGYYANGVVEQIWTCNNGSNQVFTLATTGQLTIDGGQYCLADASSATATGTHPELFTCGSQSHERWTMRSDGSIVGVHSGLCINAPGNSDGTQLDFEPCGGQAHERWSWD